MDNILLCSNHIPLVTSIHNTFIEKYMLGANGSYVKVYLYLSKCIQAGEEDLSISSLADKMENTEKDILRALNYWEKQKLLKITRSEDKSVILGIDVLNPDELPDTKPVRKTKVQSPDKSSKAGQAEAFSKSILQTEATSKADMPPAILSEEDLTSKAASKATLPSQAHQKQDLPVQVESKNVSKSDSKTAVQSIHVTMDQTKRLSKNEEFCWTINVVESYLEHPLSPTERNLVIYLYDNLHFSSELILYLYEYCISLGKTRSSYIQSVALAWDERNVRTPEEAQLEQANYNATYTAVSKAMALGRGLAAIEKKYVDRWQKEWNMDLSVILEACNRTMLKLQHADFKYIEGILDRWRKADVHTLADIERLDQDFAKSKEQKSYSSNRSNAQKNTNSAASRGMVQHQLSNDDMDALEKKLLSR